VTGFCLDGNERSGSIKGGEFLERLSASRKGVFHIVNNDDYDCDNENVYTRNYLS